MKIVSVPNPIGCVDPPAPPPPLIVADLHDAICSKHCL